MNCNLVTKYDIGQDVASALGTIVAIKLRDNSGGSEIISYDVVSDYSPMHLEYAECDLVPIFPNGHVFMVLRKDHTVKSVHKRQDSAEDCCFVRDGEYVIVKEVV